MPVISASKELIVLRLGVADVCSDSQADGVGIECLGRGGSTDAGGVFPTCVLCDDLLSSNGARRVTSPYFRSELLEIDLVGGEFLFGASLSSSSASRSVLETGGLSGFESWLFYEETLALVAFARTAPLQHDCPECVLPRTSDDVIKGLVAHAI